MFAYRDRVGKARMRQVLHFNGDGALRRIGVGDAPGCLVFFGLIVPTHWLLIGMIISVVALLVAAGGIVRHVLLQRRVKGEESVALDADGEIRPDSTGAQSARPDLKEK